MARSISEIQQEIIDSKNADPVLVDLNSPSASAVWRLWSYITAVAINLHEQFLDLGKIELEELARDAVAGTADWLQKRALEFQYSVSDPQVITVINGVATYPTVDENLRIITRASVTEKANGRVLIKVAKGDVTLSPLDVNELSAAISYFDKIGFVGIPLDTISLNADRLRFEGSVYFYGEYVSTEVKSSVIEAINGYLKSISVDGFDGTLVRENLIDAIQSVDGVAGIDTLNVQLNGRPEQDPLGGGNNINIQRKYDTTAGYMIPEDTANNTLEDTITMILN